MKKKAVSLLMVAAMMTTMAAGCGNKAANNAGSDAAADNSTTSDAAADNSTTTGISLSIMVYVQRVMQKQRLHRMLKTPQMYIC